MVLSLQCGISLCTSIFTVHPFNFLVATLTIGTATANDNVHHRDGSSLVVDMHSVNDRTGESSAALRLAYPDMLS